MALPRMPRPVVLGSSTGAAALVLLYLLLKPAALAGSWPAPGALALRLLAGPALLVLAMSLATSLTRGLTAAFNPLADPERPALRLGQRVLTNTVEQSAVFVPALLAWSAALPADRAGVLALTAALFCLARLAFWIGYAIHPFARAPGMAATFLINTATVAGALTGWAG